MEEDGASEEDEEEMMSRERLLQDMPVDRHTLFIFGQNKRTSWWRDPSEEQLSAKMVNTVKSSQGDFGSTESHDSQKKTTPSSTDFFGRD